MICSPAGTLQLDLVSGSALNDPLAKCLNSMLVTINGACSLTVTPLSAADNFVTGLWGAAGTYTNLMACPIIATAALEVQ